MTIQIAKRRPDPFDGSSGARLSRMGLLAGMGDVDEAAMQGFIHIFAASFFDDLCDTYESLEAISKITAAFCELEERNDPQRIFLLLSLQYDALRKPLPDPVWWLAGHATALTRFSLGFTAYLSQLMANMEKKEKEADPQQLIEEPFDQEGWCYTFADIVKEENQVSDRKYHTETVTLETATKDHGKILEQLDTTLDDDDGTYSGVLALDHTAIRTEASGYTSQAKNITATKTKPSGRWTATICPMSRPSPSRTGSR